MESHINIDYTEKIRTFQALVDNYNEEIALNYLTKANWDEMVNLFFKLFLREQLNYFLMKLQINDTILIIRSRLSTIMKTPILGIEVLVIIEGKTTTTKRLIKMKMKQI